MVVGAASVTVPLDDGLGAGVGAGVGVGVFPPDVGREEAPLESLPPPPQEERTATRIVFRKRECRRWVIRFPMNEKLSYASSKMTSVKLPRQNHLLRWTIYFFGLLTRAVDGSQCNHQLGIERQ
jgi:hypothetical protein